MFVVVVVVVVIVVVIILHSKSSGTNSSVIYTGESLFTCFATFAYTVQRYQFSILKEHSTINCHEKFELHVLSAFGAMRKSIIQSSFVACTKYERF